MFRFHLIFRFGLVVTCLVSPPSWGQDDSSLYPSARHGGNYMHNYYFPPFPSSAPWAPSWSPDGKWLAVAMSGSIWKVRLEDGVAFEATHGSTYHSLPDWSPDGRWIVYAADDDGTTIQLEILEVESGAVQKLTHDEFIYMDPVFSADGTRLAYVSTRPNGYFNVHVRSIREGRWAGEELSVTEDHNFGRSRLYFGEWDMHISPAWLPGGDELLIVSNRNVPLGSGNVLRLPAAEQGIGKARSVLAEQTLYRTRPDVSPDGRRFVYSSTAGTADQFSNLYVQPTEGGEPYKLTFFQHDAFHPRWSPDGEWIAYISNEGGLPNLALLETYGGRQKKIQISRRQWKRPVGKLVIRTVEDLSGKPTAARIHLAASDGKFYSPPNAYARISQMGLEHLFHQQGSSTLEAPVGEVSLVAVKGFEFWPAEARVEIREGTVTEVTLRLRRLTDMQKQGWYSGSTHVHMNYGGNLHNTLENLLFMSEAEDLDVVNEQIANKDNRILDYQFFVPGGSPHPLSTSERMLVVGQEYRPPFYGHVFLMGLREHLISPYTTGYEGTAVESLYPSNTDILRKAKAQGATVGYVHAFSSDSDPLLEDLGGAKGYIVDAALETTDAVEWSVANRGGFQPWYATLNNGIRVAAVGGEDSISDLQISKLLGSVRTFVHTGSSGLDMEAWYAGLRKGNSFVTTGPLLEFAIDGKMPGEEIQLTEGGADVRVKARVLSITPLKRAELVVNGTVVRELEFQGNRRSLDLDTTVRIQRSSWAHLRVEGEPHESSPLDTAWAQAFTNPVWILVEGRPIRSRESAAYCLRWIDRLQEMAEEWPGWRSDREKRHVLEQFDQAREVYRGFVAEASGR